MSATIIEETTREAARVDAKLHHVAALLQALGNPSEWKYTGDIGDAGNSECYCACGHPIRYMFFIEHPQRGRAHVGSTCIEHIAHVAPELGDTLRAARDAHLQKLAELKKAAKRAQDDAENQRLWAEYCAARDAAIAAHRANRQAGRRSAWDLWSFAESYRCTWRKFQPPVYLRACDLRRWLTRAINVARSVLQPATANG